MSVVVRGAELKDADDDRRIRRDINDGVVHVGGTELIAGILSAIDCEEVRGRNTDSSDVFTSFLLDRRDGFRGGRRSRCSGALRVLRREAGPDDQKKRQGDDAEGFFHDAVFCLYTG